MKSHFLARATGAFCALAAIAAPAASATPVPSVADPATYLPGLGNACSPSPTSKAFAKLDGDGSDYSVAPGGNFETGATGWALTGGARVVGGNENRGVSTGSRSLRMPVGSTATSPKFCVDETYPHFRFAYKVDGGFSGFIALVLYQRDGVTTQAQLTSSEKLSITPSAWSLTPKSPLASIIPLQGGRATVQIKLLSVTIAGKNDAMNGVANVLANPASALANVGVSVDSVMVDPYRRS